MAGNVKERWRTYKNGLRIACKIVRKGILKDPKLPTEDILAFEQSTRG